MVFTLTSIGFYLSSFYQINNFLKDPLAIVIDFGRSEIVSRRSGAKKMLRDEYKQFCLELDSNGSIDT